MLNRFAVRIDIKLWKSGIRPLFHFNKESLLNPLGLDDGIIFYLRIDRIHDMWRYSSVKEEKMVQDDSPDISDESVAKGIIKINTF